MNGKRREISNLQIGLAAAGAVLLFWFILEINFKNIERLSSFQTVLLARHDIARFAVLSTNDIIPVKMPLRYIQPAAFRNKNQLFRNGSPAFFASMDILEGTQITKSMLADTALRDVAYMIPEGMRAVNIRITDRNFFDLLFPGNRVDFVVYQKNRSFYVLQNILIIKKGPLTLQSTNAGRSRNIPYDNVTLLLSQKDALKLAFLFNMKFEVLCRNFMDKEVLENRVLLGEDFLGEPYRERNKAFDLTSFLETGKLRAEKGDYSGDEGELLTRKYMGLFTDRALQQRIQNKLKTLKE